MSTAFEPFPKIARLKRELVITEKLDGTNAQVYISYAMPDGKDNNYIVAQRLTEVGTQYMMAGSRKRYIAPEGTVPNPEKEGKFHKGTDNFGFAAWVRDNAESLWDLGDGRHYGEWYGKGIQRGYDLEDKRFALFNVARWADGAPDCCEVVTRITGEEGELVEDPDEAMAMLDAYGSQHCYYDSTEDSVTKRIRFDNPEGIVCWHTASRTLYKVTFDNDDLSKWQKENAS